MDKAKESTIQIGPGLIESIFLILLTLKLCGVIDWSWLWVWSPLFIGPAIIALFAAGAYAFSKIKR